MANRNIVYPSIAVAIFLGFIAFSDAGSAWTSMQLGDAGNGGWVIDLAAAAITVAVVTFLLMKPHLLVFAATEVWVLLSLIVNFALRDSERASVDVSLRLAVYTLAFVAAGILLGFELFDWYKKYSVERAKQMAQWAAMNPGAWPPGAVPGAFPPGAFPPGYQPPAAPAAPPAPPAPPAK
jgi:hypothetical protein